MIWRWLCKTTQVITLIWGHIVTYRNKIKLRHWNFFIRYTNTHSIELDLDKMVAYDCNDTENCHYLEVDLDAMCVRFPSKIKCISDNNNYNLFYAISRLTCVSWFLKFLAALKMKGSFFFSTELEEFMHTNRLKTFDWLSDKYSHLGQKRTGPFWG